MIRSFIIACMLLFSVNVVLAENITGTQQSKEPIKHPTKLDLSIPDNDLNFKPDTSKKTQHESKEKGVKKNHCADLSRKIEKLRGQYKMARRSALINQHRAECLNKGPWQSIQD